MINPSKTGTPLSSPVERANKLNDPQFENVQGYFPYDLTHSEYVTPLFGQITPTMSLDTVSGDRVVMTENIKTIHNQINGNFLSTINQYSDSFFVPLRNVFPYNYEKLLPNPVKGDDLPNSALPQVPFAHFVYRYLNDDTNVMSVYLSVGSLPDTVTPIQARLFLERLSTYLGNYDEDEGDDSILSYGIGRLVLISTVLSRGQLLDYLGYQLDTNIVREGSVVSKFQECIDDFFRYLWLNRNLFINTNDVLYSTTCPLTSDSLDFVLTSPRIKTYDISTLSKFRSALSDIFEAGRFPIFRYSISKMFDIYNSADGDSDSDSDSSDSDNLQNVELYNLERFIESITNLFIQYDLLFKKYDFVNDSYIDTVDNSSNPFADGGYINIGKILAYQQVVAHYYTNDKVDNIFSSDLFMQNLRSIMYPSVNGFSSEPTFDYNGVSTEYDLISCGGFFNSLLSSNVDGILNRQWVWLTVMMLMRRSLRYGDYFTTARPNMLAVSDQLGINVTDGQVSPVDVTKNLLMQRYLNAANYIGQGFLQYMSSIFGVKPSDTGCIPRFISHRKIELQDQITNNTADNQGYQTTNLVGFSDNTSFDVFIDDFGYLLTLTSYDVLPVYKSGIDNSYHFSDRFDYFNPLLQGIGDQPIRLSEAIGTPGYYGNTFGYTMRNGEYKYKLSKAHGAFVNSLPGFLLSYPLDSYLENGEVSIAPDFIRDKPIYFDNVITQQTGVSPGEYYHFIVAAVNQVQCARKIQATPGVLF